MGSMNYDLIAVTDSFPEPGESVFGGDFYTSSGGKGGNQAVAASRLGAQTMMVGRVGNDHFGREMLDSLKVHGVDTSGVTIEPGVQSGIAHITIDSSGQNKIVIVPGANALCDESEVERVKLSLKNADVLLLQMELPLELSLKAAAEANRLGRPVVFDPAPAGLIPDNAYRMMDYLIPNETEASRLTDFPVKDPALGIAAAVELRRRGAQVVIVKMGRQGVCYSSPDGEGHLSAFDVKMIDSVAAGDAFNGAFAVAIAQRKILREALFWAMSAGAVAVTKRGAHDAMPSLEEVEALMVEQPRT